MFKCEKCGAEYKLVPVTSDTKPKHPSLTEVEVALGDHAKLMEFSQAGANGAIVVKPKGWLGKQTFGEVAEKLKQFDARYISEGKNSRWEL